ncbi:MAG: type VII secretion protein EccB [Micromonosporaceae bacterium]
MASRKDQLHSYQFMIQRVVAALVMRETDPAQSPFRRAAGAIFAGVMVAAIAVAGFAIYGLWDPGGNMRWKTWSDQNKGKPVAVIEEETGAAYVYQAGILYPVENFTSAVLWGSRDQSGEPYFVSRESLVGAQLRVGPRLGIPGAPDSLPSQENLTDEDWTLCSQPTPQVQQPQEPGELETLMVVGGTPSPKRHVAGEGVMLVNEKETGIKYLIYKSHRLKIIAEHQEATFNAFGLDSIAMVDVGTAWLSALPVGQDIEPLTIKGAGEPSSVLTGATVGTVYRVDGVDRFYVALKDKFAVLRPFQAKLLEASTGEQPAPLSAASVGETSQEYLPENVEPGVQVPPEASQLHLERPDPEKATCAIFQDNGEPPTMVYDGSMAVYDAYGEHTPVRDSEGKQLANRVIVVKGKGALVRTSEDRDATAGSTLGLVTDTGKFYPLSSEEVVSKLGYNPKTVHRGWMPIGLVERLQMGPTLDPDAVWEPVTLVN